MNKSNEKKERRFGRWADMNEWFNEASCVKEKTKPSGKIETISVFGNWCLRVYIPMREGGGYESAMETALTLLAEIGTRPEDAYLELGYCVIFLGSGEFYRMKALAEEIQRWLLSRAIRTTVGDSFPTASNDEICAHLRFEQDKRIVRAAAASWQLTIEFPNNKFSAAAANLLVELELTAERSDPGLNRWSVWCDINDFALAKSKASQTIAWLTRNGYEIQTSWGDVDFPLQSLDEETLIGLNETGNSFYRFDVDSAAVRVKLTDSAHDSARGSEEIRKLKRLQARLTESAEKVSVVLNRAQVNVLLDLAGECLDHQSGCVQVIEAFYMGGYHIEEEEWAQCSEARKLEAPLSELTQDLRNALDGLSTRGWTGKREQIWRSTLS